MRREKNTLSWPGRMESENERRARHSREEGEVISSGASRHGACFALMGRADLCPRSVSELIYVSGRVDEFDVA